MMPSIQRKKAKNLAHRLVLAVSVMSILVAFPAIADPLFNGADVRLAFADIAGPRGITLSGGEDEADQKPPAGVTFNQPFSDTDDAINGKSIRELIGGSPHFAPIEGLPETLWKDKKCSSCHAWTQKTLCEQGRFYEKQGLGAVERKEHPYGGAFKREVMRWADQGCE